MTHLPNTLSCTPRSLAAVAALLTLAAAPASLWAQQSQQQPQAQEPAWGLGLAVSANRKPYRSFDHKAQPLPLVTYENRWISIMGPGDVTVKGKAQCTTSGTGPGEAHCGP